jgi:hypothetical protein
MTTVPGVGRESETTTTADAARSEDEEEGTSSSARSQAKGSTVADTQLASLERTTAYVRALLIVFGLLLATSVLHWNTFGEKLDLEKREVNLRIEELFVTRRGGGSGSSLGADAEVVLKKEKKKNAKAKPQAACASAFRAVEKSSELVANVVASSKPFPHLILDNVFPQDYYELMLENVLDTHTTKGDLFHRRSAVKPRYTLILLGNVTASEHDSDLNKRKVEFWRCHYLAYGTRQFTSALLRPFRAIVERRYNGTIKYDADKFYQAMSLVQDRDSYFITPHTDVYTKFVTNLFYLGNERDAQALRTSGTLIMKPYKTFPRRRQKKGKKGKKSTATFDSEDYLQIYREDLKRVGLNDKVTTLQDFDASKDLLLDRSTVYKFKQMDFRANRLVAFAPCDNAWHSVPRQHFPNGVMRNTVQGFVSFAGSEGIPDKESCDAI